MATFSERLKWLRDKKGYSQESLGKLFNLTQSVISHYEHGRKQPSYQTMQKLANFFEVSLDYLFGCTDDPTPPNTRAPQKPSSEVSAEKAEAEEIAEMIMKLNKKKRQTAKMIIASLGDEDEQAASKA